MGFTIITTPFWTAYTDAFHKNDFAWIKRITKKLTIIWGLSIFAVIGMLIFSDVFYKLWIGNQIKIPFLLSAYMAVWVLISAWTSIFGNLINVI